MARAKLTPDQRREIVLAALRGVPVMELSIEHGVARSWIYAIVDDATADPAVALEKAEREVAFRRAVVEEVAGK